MNILIDSCIYDKAEFGLSFDFLLAHGLIEYKQYQTSYKVNFVGEVHTPHHDFISLPKNFENKTQENIELVRSIIKEFKNVRKNNRILIQNKTYIIGDEIDSDFFYWKKLYTYFTDYITYEFYHPKKRITRHSTRRQQGHLNPMLSDRNREQRGIGMTYEIKNYEKDEVRDVYYSTLKNLERTYASNREKDRIREMEEFLRKKGFQFGLIEVNRKQFLAKAQSIQTNAIHEGLLKTIINYYKQSKINEQSTINVFYTQEFEYLYQYVLQKILRNNTHLNKAQWVNPNYKTLNPDIITEKFIGDAKYYRLSEVEKSPFEKELYAYNIANNNSQRNIVFILGEQNKYNRTLQHKEYKLILVSLSLADIMHDYSTNEGKTLKWIESLE